jgi:hypothetical protein
MSRAQRKAEELKRRKEKRKKEWARLMKEKPDQRYENPQDEQEIRTARATLGNFQLKTSSDYVVPEHLRSNTKQKKRRIAAITLNIYETKKVFNEKVRTARNEKIEIRKDVIRLTDQIKNLEKKLPKEDFLK